MKKSISILFILFFSMVNHSFAQVPLADPFAHTFSIVAHDPVTGDVGVAVQSHWFSVGTVVAWAEAGVGAVATQSFVNVSFGRKGLDLLKEGYSPQEALDTLIAGDEGRDFRQVAIVDVKGRVANYTGAKCVAEAGHIKGKGYSVQANMMLKNTVWSAMDKAFTENKGTLAERMIMALKAAQVEGGDIRGQQAASLIVVKGKKSDKTWEDKIVDIRVDDHPDAVNELARLLNVHQAYEHMNAGDLAVERNDIEGALKEYGSAMAMFPENIEMKYWTAVSMANAGKVKESLKLFKEVFKADGNWVELTRRIIPNGLLVVDDSALARILEQAK